MRRRKAGIEYDRSTVGSYRFIDLPDERTELAQHNREALHAILEDAAKNTSAPAGTDAQKLGAFYRACMNEAGIEKAGTGPIDPMLADVGRVASIPALVDEIGKLHVVGVNGRASTVP